MGRKGYNMISEYTKNRDRTHIEHILLPLLQTEHTNTTTDNCFNKKNSLNRNIFAPTYRLVHVAQKKISNPQNHNLAANWQKSNKRRQNCYEHIQANNINNRKMY